MLSIVIPTYNEEAYLPCLLASIRSQQFDDYEIIVADAFSKDRTREVAVSFGARVVDGGMPGPGRNLGAAAAKGDLLLFLDADVVLPDDQWLGNKVRQFYRRKLDAGTCLIKPLSFKAIDRFSHGVYNLHMLAMQFVHEHAPGFCLFATKRMHDRIGGFDPSIKLAEDHDYVRRASEFGKFRVLLGPRIRVSVRRFERDGRLNIFAKYLLVELYNVAKGPIKTDAFNYTFGHAKPHGTQPAEAQARKRL